MENRYKEKGVGLYKVVDKENVPLVHQNKSKMSDANRVFNNNTKFTIYQEKSIPIKTVRENIVTKTGNVRLPLQDVAITHVQNNAARSESSKENKERKGKNIIGWMDHEHFIKDISTLADTSGEYEETGIKAKDSFPLNVQKLNSTKSERLEEELINSLDTKYVTYQRNYDPLKIEESSDTSFFNVSDSSFLFDNNSTVYDTYHDVMIVSQPQDTKKTPSNTNNLPVSIDIKQIRKQHQSSSSKDGIHESLIYNKGILDRDLRINLKNSQISTSLITIKTQKPTQKECLQKVNVLGTVDLDIDEPFVPCRLLYTPKYIESFVCHMLRKESSIKLSKTNHLISDLNRAVVVNWLIKLQTYIKSDHTTLYTAVRLLDRTIHSLEIPLESLQLVALASFWISLKFHGVVQRGAKYMVKLTEEAYTATDLTEMECTLLTVNNFKINPIDITAYVHYYILLLKLANADIISACSHYLLKCSYLSSMFLSIQTSHLAAGVVFTSLHLMKQYSYDLWMKMKGHNGYYYPEHLVSLKEALIDILYQVSDSSFPCREPFFIYSNSKYHKVSLIMLDNLMHGQITKQVIG